MKMNEYIEIEIKVPSAERLVPVCVFCFAERRGVRSAVWHAPVCVARHQFISFVKQRSVTQSGEDMVESLCVFGS